MCVFKYKMVNIDSNTWNKAGVSVIQVHETGNVNKTLLQLLCICDLSKRWGGKNICDLIDKEIKGNNLQNSKSESIK